jgi:hypothetical protein
MESFISYLLFLDIFLNIDYSMFFFYIYLEIFSNIIHITTHILFYKLPKSFYPFSQIKKLNKFTVPSNFTSLLIIFWDSMHVS